ncbi:putative glycine-rich cell wall structural protein 1 [Ceratitis capitata]|uniref:putative glycine-rich cell wall structural protein 1 n=1 Tax=Ceratitis capitata TaxID=7213 RepID=UPI0003299BDE|nr:putative glycine-rich cell wall structural protein 1 [Ceratitis capitata]
MKPSLPQLRQAGVILLALNCVLLCTAQGGNGGAGGWGGAPGQPGAPGAPGNSDFGFGYAGIDSRGHAYGGAGGNGGYYVGGVDDQGRRFSYSGGAGGMPGMPGAPGGYPVAPGAPVGPGNYPNYYDPRYRSAANAVGRQLHWLWLLLPLTVFLKVL